MDDFTKFSEMTEPIGTESGNKKWKFKEKKIEKHIHRYHKVKIELWACSFASCNHHMPRHMESLLPGKLSRCNKCNDTFILNKRNMKNNKPLCNKCSKKV